jgi:hypothetical protein
LSTQDIPNNGAVGEFLGISAGGVLDWLPVSASGSGDMLKSENLSGLASYPTARTNLGLGTGDSPTFKNLTISTGTITTSAPVTISQTWNGTGSTVFKALVVNATTPGTTSSASSLLLDLQVGGVSQFYVDKSGTLRMRPLDAETKMAYSAAGFLFYGSGAPSLFIGQDGTGAGNAVMSSTGFIGFASTSVAASGNSDTRLYRDGAANTLALRNGAAAQTFNVYGTYSTSPSLAYSRLAIACDTSGNATLTTQSTGTAGTVSINGVPVGRGKNSISTNIAIGTNALNSITSGTDNIAIGTNAQLNTAAISNCVAIGSSAMGSGSSQSVGIGSLSLQNSGNQSVAIGYAAVSNAVVSDTVGIGWASLYATQANHVVALGTNSGRYIANGSTVNAVATNSIFIGGITKALDTAQTNQIVIGYDATGLGSNTAVLGNASITTTALRGNVGVGTTAPSRPLTVVGNVSGVNLCLLQNTNSAGYTELAFDNDTAFAGNLGGFVFGLGGTTTPSPNEAYFFNRRSAAIFFGTNATERMRITAAGNVGIGTTAPSSKLQVTGGDIEVSTIASGLILKSPDGTRYRVTVANGGTLSVATA